MKKDQIKEKIKEGENNNQKIVEKKMIIRICERH